MTDIPTAPSPLRIAILGAGGVGGWYAGVLALAGHDVSVLARGDHLDVIRSSGLELRSADDVQHARVNATDDVGQLGRPELVIVSVKSYSLAGIATAAARLAEGGAAILPLLNGVDAADRLAALGVPPESVIGGLTVISAARVAPGVIERRSPFQRITMGALGGAHGSPEEWAPRLASFAQALRSAGVETTVSSSIEIDLWNKFAFLASIAAACGLARASIDAVRAAPLGALLIERAVREIIAVAVARGMSLGTDAAVRTIGAIEALAPGMKPSLLLDLERGAETEVDVLSGAIARMGREHGIATPVHDTAWAAIGSRAEG
ncbi:MAG: 2-dehydropantoate 2-reductase [Gemmatimonadaceae bacterium]